MAVKQFNLTSKSSGGFASFSPKALGSHWILCSSAIAFKILILVGPSGATTDNFSTNWKRQHKMVHTRYAAELLPIISCQLNSVTNSNEHEHAYEYIYIYMERENNMCKLTMRLTPLSGRSSMAAEVNSFPYFTVKCFRISRSSGMSAHLGDANITLATASFKSIGQFL